MTKKNYRFAADEIENILIFFPEYRGAVAADIFNTINKIVKDSFGKLSEAITEFVKENSVTEKTGEILLQLVPGYLLGFYYGNDDPEYFIEKFSDDESYRAIWLENYHKFIEDMRTRLDRNITLWNDVKDIKLPKEWIEFFPQE